MISINDADKCKLVALYEKHQDYHKELNNILGILNTIDGERRDAINEIKSLDKNDPQFSKSLAELDVRLDGILCVLNDAWKEHKNLVRVIKQTEYDTEKLLDVLSDKYGDEIKDINILNNIING